MHIDKRKDHAFDILEQVVEDGDVYRVRAVLDIDKAAELTRLNVVHLSVYEHFQFLLSDLVWSGPCARVK